jgi:hypothetical protein
MLHYTCMGTLSSERDGVPHAPKFPNLITRAKRLLGEFGVSVSSVMLAYAGTFIFSVGALFSCVLVVALVSAYRCQLVFVWSAFKSYSVAAKLLL